MNTTYLKKFGVAKTGVAPYDGWTGNQNQNLYGKGLTLEKWQVEAIKHRYYKLDDETWEQISIIMDDMKGELNANHN